MEILELLAGGWKSPWRKYPLPWRSGFDLSMEAGYWARYRLLVHFRAQQFSVLIVFQ